MIDVIGVIDVISWLFCQTFSLNHRVHVIAHMRLMIGHKSDKCDMRVLRVPVTWFFVFLYENSNTISL